MNNIHLPGQKGSNSIERRKNENNFEIEPQYVLSTKNSKSNQQLQTNSNAAIKLNAQFHQTTNNVRELGYPEQNKKTKFVVGGQFRAKNAKKQLVQQNKLLQEPNFAHQYQVQNSAASLQQPPFSQFGQAQTTTNAQRQSMFPTGIQNIQQQQQLMNSQPSNKSLRSSGSQEQGQFPSQDNQYRRRLVALAQAQQQQIIAIHQANTNQQNQKQQLKFLRQQNEQSRRDQQEGQDGLKVLSKKVISFRTHSKSQEKNTKIYGENSERMVEFRSQQPTVKSAENTKLNHTQTIAGILEHQTFGFRPNINDSVNKNQTTNVSGVQLSGFNQSAVTTQLSPRKQGTETFGTGAVGGKTPHHINASNEAKESKATRLISGNPQRRLQQQPQVQGSEAGQTTNINPLLTQGVEDQNCNNGNHALQGFLRRRQPGDEAMQIANALSSTKKSIEFQNLAGANQKSYQTLQVGSQDALQSDIKETKSRPQPQKLPSSQATNQQAAQVSGSGTVIYHPHPLNQNIANMNTIQNGQLTENMKSDSARPSTQKYTTVNTRNSRKNLKPLTKTKQQSGSNPNLNLRASRTKNPSRQQYASHIQAPTQIDAPISSSLHFSQADLAASTSRERTQKVPVGTNYNSQAPSGQNKVSMFKVKRHSSTNRGSQAAYQSQSNTARGRPINQGIVVRKNNYVTQQNSMQPSLKMATITEPSPAARLKQPALASKQNTVSKKPNIPQIRNPNAALSDMKQSQAQTLAQQFKPTSTQVHPFAESGAGNFDMDNLASLRDLPGFEQFVEEQHSGPLGSTENQFENIKNQLQKLGFQENIAKHPQTTRASNNINQQHQSKSNKDAHQTILGSLTQNFSQPQQQQLHQQRGGLVVQGSEQSIQTNNQINLKLENMNNINNNKLIKVNKSKKMLDSARRSRIQQLDKDAYNSQVTVEAGTEKNYKSTAQPSRTKQITAQNSSTLPLSSTDAKDAQDDNYGKNVQIPKAPVQTKFQLNMNINTSSSNSIVPATTQGNLHVNLMKEQKSARGANNEQQHNNGQIVPPQPATQRFTTIQNQNENKAPLEIKRNEGGQKLRRGQIFKKQQQSSQNHIDNQQLNSIQVIKELIQTKEVSPPNETNNAGPTQGGAAAGASGAAVFNPESTVAVKMNPAVKIENQLSPEKNQYQELILNEYSSFEKSKQIDDTISPYQPDFENGKSLNETDQDFKIQMNQVIKEIEDNETKTQQLNDVSGEKSEIVSTAAQAKQAALLQTQTQVASKKVLVQQKVTVEQRTTMDTNTNRKTNVDSQQRFNINTSIQNVPRGMINTAFSLGSVVSREKEIPALPTTPQNILRYYINDLTDYEKGEILDYERIYFIGKSKEKKVDGIQSVDKNKDLTEQSKDASSKSAGSDKGEKETYNHNYGYDDDKGDYKIVMGDHIGYRYEIVEFLGKGSFGTALRCIDHKEKKDIAIKIVKNKKKYYYQASVELKILQYLKQHDVEDIMNVIHIYDYVVFRKHLCMGFELLSMNLFEFLKINDFNGFDHNLIRRFAIQLLYALKYLKQLEIIHCDLKPENILLKEENKSGIKIIDFGSSTFIDEKVYTYIQSRFYRAPEIMLGIPYTPAIDMWSLGCIMAELYIGYPIFPGESENDQMSRIMEMRDVPSAEVLKMSERKGKFFTKSSDGKYDPIMLKNSRGKLRKPNGKPLDYVIGDEDDDFNDFVIKCLDWNPNTRLTPDDALKHVWVLKGLPPQVLIHHQKMHNIGTPELPNSVKVARDEFLIEQQREQQIMLKKQQQRVSNQQRQSNQKDTKREISHNPDVGRPHIQLKTPRNAQQKINIDHLSNSGGTQQSQNKSGGGEGAKMNLNQVKKIILNNTSSFKTQLDNQQSNSQGNSRGRKFVIKQNKN